MNTETKATEWLLSGDTGESSKAICSHMLFGKQHESAAHPNDPADIGRCFRLLAKIPEWESRIGEMSAYGAAWISLSERWQEIKDCMEEEVGIDWSKGDRANKTYAMMKVAISDGYRKDNRYECQFRDDGTLISSWRKGSW